MKIALITDTHFGARNDSKQMQASQSQFLEDVFFPTLDREGITEVVHLGDYGDRRKYINYNTANFINTSYRNPLKERGIHETVLVGNHDAYYRHTNELNSITELYRTDTSITIITDPAICQFGGLDVLMVPWICESNHAQVMQLIQTAAARVCMGHFEMLNFQMYRGQDATEGLDPAVFWRFERVFSGHYHHKSTAGNVTYLGAPWPMVWSDFNDERGFHLFDTETLTLTFIENHYSLFKRFVYNDAGKPPSYIKDLCAQATSAAPNTYVKVVVQHKDQPFWFDTFIETIHKAVPLDLQIIDEIVVDLEAMDKVMTADMDTGALIREYIMNAHLNCNKEALLDYLDKIYREATQQRG